jgi:dihydrofolate reductase
MDRAHFTPALIPPVMKSFIREAVAELIEHEVLPKVAAIGFPDSVPAFHVAHDPGIEAVELGPPSVRPCLPRRGCGRIFIARRRDMRRLVVFNSVTLDGYFTDLNGDMSWAHSEDVEFNTFVEGNAKGGGELVFGRITYDLMASFWPTPAAIKSFPVVAGGMNDSPKVVFSRSMEKASWNNTRVVKGDAAAEMRKLKKEPGKDLVIMGSGSLVAQLAEEGLIDEYQLVVIPVVIGGGRTMFDGVKGKLALKLKSTRAFRNGNVFLRYE